MVKMSGREGFFTGKGHLNKDLKEIRRVLTVPGGRSSQARARKAGACRPSLKRARRPAIATDGGS